MSKISLKVDGAGRTFKLYDDETSLRDSNVKIVSCCTEKSRFFY